MSGIWKIIKTGGPNLQVFMSLTCTSECERTSKDFLIDDFAKVRFKWDVKKCKDSDEPEVTFQFSVANIDNGKSYPIKTNITSESLKYSQTSIDTLKMWSEWEVMGTLKPTAGKKTIPWLCYILVDFLVIVYEVQTDIILSPKLYFDSDFTDFSLSTTDGSVAVHKACLAAHSDVFKAMLKGEWKETVEGQINIQGVTLQTLQLLKDYLYFGMVDKDDVDELCSLLLLARRYLIEDLEKHCIRKIAETVSSEELFSIMEFACENRIPELPFAILQVTKDSVVSKAYKLKKKQIKEKFK